MTPCQVSGFFHHIFFILSEVKRKYSFKMLENAKNSKNYPTLNISVTRLFNVTSQFFGLPAILYGLHEFLHIFCLKLILNCRHLHFLI
jgi:hypothetical protein